MVKWQIGQRVVYTERKDGKEFFGEITDVLIDKELEKKGEYNFSLFIKWDGHRESHEYADCAAIVSCLRLAVTLPKDNPNVKFREEYREKQI